MPWVQPSLLPPANAALLTTQIEDSDPETNTLPKTLKPLLGKALSLETNDTPRSLLIFQSR
jgi:hypothetical protein